MFDIWLGDVELTTLTMILSVGILLPVQLLLCFRAGRLPVRLLPVCLLSALTAGFLLLRLSATGWDGLFYDVFARHHAGGVRTWLGDLGRRARLPAKTLNLPGGSKNWLYPPPGVWYHGRRKPHSFFLGARPCASL